MIFQPAAGPPDPWSLGEYQMASTLFWIAAILTLIFGFFMLVDYINNRKVHHLAWSVSLLLMWTLIHQLIPFGDYTFFLDPLIMAGSSMILGLVAAGLIYNTFAEKKLIGHIWLLFVLVMTVVIAIIGYNLGNQADLKQYLGPPGEDWPDPNDVFVPVLQPIVNLVLTLPSLAIIVLLPIYTTLISKSTKLVALLMPIGAFLLGINAYYLNVFLLITGTYQVTYWMWDLWTIFTMYQFFLLFGVSCIAFGMLIPKKWSFKIPGVEFEER
ncbi:MAG: hypothetical protein ACFE85_11270 [Candidatus Hodarchaeota archaeon]